LSVQLAAGKNASRCSKKSRTKSSRRQRERSTRLLEPRGEAAGADFVEHRDRRHVERKLQGTAHRHRALEIEIEILRRIGAEADGAILDQGIGMDETVLEAEPIDEGFVLLSRRAGLIYCLR
jgi:hypothetical protein